MIIYVNENHKYTLLRLLNIRNELYFETIGPNSTYVTVDYNHIIATIIGKQIYSNPSHKTSMIYDIEEKDLPIIKSLIQGIFNYEV